MKKSTGLKFNQQCSPLLIGLVIVSLLAACRSKNYHFDVQPKTIKANDSVFVSWENNRNGKLLIYDTYFGDDIIYRNFKLVDPGHSKRVIPPVQVAILNKARIVFHGHLSNDSLIVSEQIDKVRFGNKLIINSIINTSGRDLDISHSGRSVKLAPDEESRIFKGTSVNGLWQFRSALSDKEKSNSELIKDDKLSVLISF
ncbi:hypothetical protein OQX61_23830 [Pedobacter sp. PLR]|uniref:hypothetical protein n=1 Tax=Pedobacter sp. PLR TaxID=2994465 RepID=UPI002245C5F9|nr:hypothetical protein [Pedobacter sp. PLR]MCX2454321.1 hypothetical protein [Pedobacter sp. PLR]